MIKKILTTSLFGIALLSVVLGVVALTAKDESGTWQIVNFFKHPSLSGAKNLAFCVIGGIAAVIAGIGALFQSGLTMIRSWFGKGGVFSIVLTIISVALCAVPAFIAIAGYSNL